MKKTIYMLLLFVLSNQIYAQNKQNEAIAAYQLAEENFEKGNYQSALDYLESAKMNFGKANSKMLYLQVYIENELYKKEQLPYETILKTIASFEKAPDIKTFNNDKKLEISKLKLTLANIEKERAKIQKENEEKEKKFDDYAYEGWPFNLSFKELQLVNKDSIIFTEKLRNFKNKIKNHDYYVSKKNVIYDDIYGQVNFFEKAGFFFPTYAKPNSFKQSMLTSVHGFLIRNDKVIGYRKVVLPLTGEYSFPKNVSKEKHKICLKYIEDNIESYIDYFGFKPVINNEYVEYGYQEYIWKKGYKTVSLYVKNYQLKNGYWEIGINEEIKDESINK